MLKKSIRFLGIISAVLVLIMSTFLTVPQPANAMKQEANTIIMEMTGTDSDDIRDLRSGEGKIYKRVAKIMEKLKAEGDTPEDAQPIIVIVKKKSSSDSRGFLD